MLHLTNLRCEYHTNPMGIDVTKPRLSWMLDSESRNVLQTAYHLQVTADHPDFQGDSPLFWDTGKVPSDQSIHLPYEGPDLQSRQRYYWRMKVWDNQGGESDWSEVAFWEMGLLDTKEWQAEWIQIGWEEDPGESQPAQLFRKEFNLKQPVRSARLYITSLGLYEAQINGSIVGDQAFTPGWTSYTHRLQYQTYDVTSQLQVGPNAIGVQLGRRLVSGLHGLEQKKELLRRKTGPACSIGGHL